MKQTGDSLKDDKREHGAKTRKSGGNKGNLYEFLKMPKKEKQKEEEVVEEVKREAFKLYFKGTKDRTVTASLLENKLNSRNLNKKELRKKCDEDFQKYWFSVDSCVKPYDRQTELPALLVLQESLTSSDEEDPETISKLVKPKPMSYLRMRRKPKSGPLSRIASSANKDEDWVQLAKESFNECYRTVVSDRNRGGRLVDVDVDSDVLEGETVEVHSGLSPREELLKEALSKQLLPFMVRDLLRIKEEQREKIETIDLKDQLLGDEKFICFTKALPLLPDVTSLVLAGNRLTDTSICPALEVACRQLSCTYLDVSNNKIDSRSIQFIKETLLSSKCHLKQLLLNKSDIDDEECADLMLALQKNSTLLRLDISNNAIGNMEEYNTVFPDFTTGGEAISEMLKANNSLLELDVSWNHISKDSALTLAKSLSVNNTLTILNLAHNNIGDRAAQFLAHSLRQNMTLTKLDVSYNMILPRGVLVFAHALEQNLNLVELNLNGNSIGPLGGQSLLRTVRLWAKSKRYLKLLYRESNLTYVDQTLFDRDNPSGSYKLNLDDPYDYAVACSLHEISNSKPISKFSELKYKFDGNDSWTDVRLHRDLTIQSSNGPWEKHITFTNKVIDAAMEEEKQVRQKLKQTSSSMSPAEALAALQLQDSAIQERAQKFGAFDAVALIGENLGLCFEDVLVIKIISVLQRIPKGKRSLVHVVLKTVFRTAYRLADKLETNSLDKNQLAKALELLGAGKAVIGTVTTLEPNSARSNTISGPSHNHHFDQLHHHRSNSNSKLPPTSWKPLLTVEQQKEVIRAKRISLAERMIAGANLDGSSSIDENTFIRLMLTAYTEFSPAPANPLVDLSTNLPWQISNKGFMQFTFQCDRLPPSFAELYSGDSIAIFSDALSQAQGKKDAKLEALKMAVMGDFYLTCEQAENLLHQFCDEVEAKFSAIAHFLPQMSSSIEACKLMSQNLSLREILALRIKMKSLFKAITGNACGHIFLDLADPIDRIAGQKLAELNSLEKNKALVETPTRDVSQCGDFENFRNATYNGCTISLNSSWFLKPPKAGKLHFDMVTTSRPVPGIRPMTSRTFRLFLHNVSAAGGDRRFRAAGKSPSADVHAFANLVQKQLSAKRSQKASRKTRSKKSAKISEDDEDDDSSEDVSSNGSSPASLDSECDEAEEGDEGLEAQADKIVERLFGRRTMDETPQHLARGGKTALGRTLLQKLHQVHKMEMAKEQRKLQGRQLDDEDALDGDGRNAIRRREAFSVGSGALEGRLGLEQSVTQALNNYKDPNRKAEPTFISWMYIIDSTWENCKKLYVDYLNANLKAAALEIQEQDRYKLTDLQAAMVQANKSNHFLNSRFRPVHRVNIKQRDSSAAVVNASNTSPAAAPALLINPRRLQASQKVNNPTALSAMDRKVLQVHQCMKYEQELLMIEVHLVLGLWFSCAQAILVAEWFIDRGAPDEVVVRAICSLFNKIVDLENFGSSIQMLPERFRAELYHRLGILNAWCPISADGPFELDLACREHREAAKLMLRLAAIEPGENLLNQEYMPSLIHPSKANWFIPTTWTEADDEKKSRGLPRCGLLKMTYTSDPSTGCVANHDARKEITVYRCLAGTRGTFVREEEMYGFSHRRKTNGERTGSIFKPPTPNAERNVTASPPIPSNSPSPSPRASPSPLANGPTRRESLRSSKRSGRGLLRAPALRRSDSLNLSDRHLFDDDEEEEDTATDLLAQLPMKQKYTVEKGPFVRAHGRL